jgi:hypothetical protein
VWRCSKTRVDVFESVTRLNVCRRVQNNRNRRV